MKTPETLFNDLKELFATDDVIEFIDNVQKEAYNKAIHDVLQKVEAYAKGEQNMRVVKSILKLKK